MLFEEVCISQITYGRTSILLNSFYNQLFLNWIINYVYAEIISRVAYKNGNEYMSLYKITSIVYFIKLEKLKNGK